MHCLLERMALHSYSCKISRFLCPRKDRVGIGSSQHEWPCFSEHCQRLVALFNLERRRARQTEKQFSGKWSRVIGDMHSPSFPATNSSERVNCLPGNSVSLSVNQLFSEVPAALTFCVTVQHWLCCGCWLSQTMCSSPNEAFQYWMNCYPGQVPNLSWDVTLLSAACNREPDPQLWRSRPQRVANTRSHLAWANEWQDSPGSCKKHLASERRASEKH